MIGVGALFCLLLVRDAHGRLVFSASNSSLYCSSTTRFLGPQYASEAHPITVPLLVFTGDPCLVGGDDHIDVAGKAVFLQVAVNCADEVLYERFQSAGACIVFRASAFWPGMTAHMQTTALRRYPDWNDMVYAEVFGPDLCPDWVRSGDHVALTLDPNLWIPMYHSVFYQTFTRWIPTLLYILGACTAWWYLTGHVRALALFARRYGARSRWQTMMFLVRNVRLAMVALFFEAGAATTMAVVLPLIGFWSESAFPAHSARFFSAHLAFLFRIGTLVSARIWHRVLHDLSSSKKPFMNRHSRLCCVLITVIPLSTDLVFQMLVANQGERTIKYLDKMNGAIFSVIDLAIGSYLLITALALYRQLQSVTVGLSLGNDPERASFARRMVVYISAFGLLLFTKVVTMMVSGAMGYWTYPNTWKYSVPFLIMSHSGRCFCRAQLLRAKRPRTRTPTPTLAFDVKTRSAMGSASKEVLENPSS